MIKASTDNGVRRTCRGSWTILRLALPVLLLPSVGCFSLPWNSAKKPEPPPAPADSLVMREGGLEADRIVDPKAQAELDSGKRLFQQKEYAKAELIFHNLIHKESSFFTFSGHDSFVTQSKKIPLPIADDSLYYEAACQFYQSNYRAAEATLRLYIKEFRTGAHADQANRLLFQIANYWLDDTRGMMQAYEEKREGKRYWVVPASYVHWGDDKPFMDIEGHAIACLEDVRLNDIGGPIGEKALFYIATIKFFHEDYKDADYYYSQLYEHYPNSTLAPKAVKQAIICKQLSTGGSCYDCRAVEESRKLIDVAVRAYPDLVNKEQDWISRQLVSVNLQQADRDFNIAEWYRRTGHPGAAYFYYELVMRRYPNTSYAEKAAGHQKEVQAKAAHEQAVAAAKANTPQSPGMFSWLSPTPSSAQANIGTPTATPTSLPQSLNKN